MPALKFVLHYCVIQIVEGSYPLQVVLVRHKETGELYVQSQA